MSNSSAKHQKRFVAWSSEHIRGLGEKNVPIRTNEGIQRCITFRGASVVKPFVSIQKVVPARNIFVLDEKNTHIRNIRDGTVIKLDVNNSGHMDLPR